MAPDPDPITNPTMTLLEAHGFQHLIAEGDILILVRYELPKDDWRVDSGDSSFHPYLEEATCFEANEGNLLYRCWTSLLSGVATQTFYDGSQASGFLTGNRNLPRIGHGLSAIYIGSGHSLTFGNTTYETCVEGSATLFSPRTVDCDTLLWHTVVDADSDGAFLDDAPAFNDNILVQIGANLEEATPGRVGQYVSNARITPMGSLFFSEAFTGIPLAAPEAFQIGAQSRDREGLALTDADTTAEATITTDSANNSNMWGWVNDFNNNHFAGALSMKLVGGVFIGLLAAFIFAAALSLANVAFAGIVAALFIFGFGVLNDLFDYKLFLIVLLMMFGWGAFTFVRPRI